MAKYELSEADKAAAADLVESGVALAEKIKDMVPSGMRGMLMIGFALLHIRNRLPNVWANLDSMVEIAATWLSNDATEIDRHATEQWLKAIKVEGKPN